MPSDPSSTTSGSEHLARGRRTLLAITASFALIVSLGAGVGMAAFLWAQGELDETSVPIGENPTTGEATYRGGKCEQEPCNYLLLGSDSREGLSRQEQVDFGTDKQIGGEQRSDTIILIHTEPGQDQATIVSFPRDLWVDIPGKGMDKINAAFAGGVRGGGPDLVSRTIEGLTGLPISHFLYVDLAGFQGVVDALGGVDMCVPYPMQDELTGLDIPAGCQEFDGTTALAFVRTRSQPCDAIPDFARIARQQQFFRAVLTKLLSPTQITKLPSLVRPVADNVVRDEKFQIFDLLGLVKHLGAVSTGDADFRAVPADPVLLKTPEYPSGIAVVEPTRDAFRMFDALEKGRSLGGIGKELEQTAISEANVEVAVYDKGSGGKADEVFTVLGQSGFNNDPGVLPAAELGGAAKGSAILTAKGDTDKAEVVAKYFPTLEIVEVDKGTITQGDVAIVVNASYRAQEPGEVGGEVPIDCGAGV